MRSQVSYASEFKYALMVEYLQQIMFQRRWIQDAQSDAEGVFVRMHEGEYTALPKRHQEERTALYRAAASLHAQVDS